MTNTYPQQHEPWRPDYPSVWLTPWRNYSLDSGVNDLLPSERNASIQSHAITIAIIDKAMKP